MDNLTECIIIGGGVSIKEGINLGLKDLIKDKFIIACNYAYKHFDNTVVTFIDRDFYKPTPEANNPDVYEELKTLPLLIGINLSGISEFQLDNTILLNVKQRPNLTGIFALQLASRIMKAGTIYLLGFDWNKRPPEMVDKNHYDGNSNLQIHYYNDIPHRGVGYVGYYENHNPDKEFKEFTKKRDIKIYNVSLNSTITCFEKISYIEFFKKLSNQNYNQTKLRAYIKNTLTLV